MTKTSARKTSTNGVPQSPANPSRGHLRSVRPRLVKQVNQRTIFDLIQSVGAISRAELARRAGASMPTASKTVARLLRLGLIEEQGMVPADGKGRPSQMYRVASARSRVFGISIEPHRCRIVSAGLDGVFAAANVHEFATPSSYSALMEICVQTLRSLYGRGFKYLRIGVSVSGTVDAATQEVLLSPNLHIMDGRRPGADIESELGIPARIVHETIATCLAEGVYREARGIKNFVMIGTYSGFGLSAIVNGELLTGAHGMAGELGHVIVQPDGEVCGCGNRGCLETLSTDPVFVRRVNQRAGGKWTLEQIVDLAGAGRLNTTIDLHATLDGLATGVAAAINIFNPELIALCTRMFDVSPEAFDYLSQRVREKTLNPLAQRCKLIRVSGDTLCGGVAAAIHHVVESLGPRMNWPGADLA